MRILIPLGTLAEAVKGIDVARELESLGVNVVICKTSQSNFSEKELDCFNLSDYSMNTYSRGIISARLMLEGQISDAAVSRRSNVILSIGDTTTAWSAALTAQNLSIPLVHLESGMRTNCINSPFPEEFFRREIDRLSTLHICFHSSDALNLKKDGYWSKNSCLIANNTIYDDIFRRRNLLGGKINNRIIVHIHRRETPDCLYYELLLALSELVISRKCGKVIVINNRRFLELHSNARSMPGLEFLDPIDRNSFLTLISTSKCIISDSGTLQEECSALSIPHLVFRNETERPYTVSCDKKSFIVGHKVKDMLPIFKEIIRSTDNETYMPRHIDTRLLGGSAKIARFIVEREHLLSCLSQI